MIIRLDKLRDGSHHQKWSGTLTGVDLVYPEAIVEVAVTADIHRLRDLITVRGRITGSLTRPCDRCLEPAEVSLDTPLHVVIRVRSVASTTEEGDDGEFIVTVAEEDSEVDITDLIRDRLVVDFPLVVHCDEACKGLCPQCGANLNTAPCTCAVNVDPRGEALKSIRNENSE